MRWKMWSVTSEIFFIRDYLGSDSKALYVQVCHTSSKRVQ